MDDILTPQFRYALKATIIGSGYRNLSEFSKSINADVALISKVIRGWEIPGVGLQKKMADGLGVTLGELRELF